MNRVVAQYGPFSKWEVDFYKDRLKNDKGVVINSFQMKLIFNMFYKYFNDTESIYGINADDYVKLMLTARKILKDHNMILLPYIISGKVEKFVGRKTVNKKEKLKIQASPYYPMIMEKYANNEKIINHILGMIATIISSDFSIIDYNDSRLDGQKIETVPDIIIEEILAYSLLI